MCVVALVVALIGSGRVLRSHSGGYLVYDEDQDTVYQCTARGRLKKEKVSLLTGDRVELDEINTDQKTAVISARFDRENTLSRPPLANVDQVIIVQAVHQPDWVPLLTDRYLVHFQLELAQDLPILCFNKCDLADENELEGLRRIYEPLGYFVIIVSARTGDGVSALAKLLADKVTVFAGQSGVGKSSLLNCIEPGLNIRVGRMDNEFGVGRHTTTASELYRLEFNDFPEVAVSQKSSWIGDTPGFNLLELRHPSPPEVVWQFPELLELAHDCKFIDCLHTVENGCNVLQNLEKLSPFRYASYLAIVEDSLSEYRLRKDTSQKLEANVKSVGGGAYGKVKSVPRLSNKYRQISRRREKQGQVEELELEDAEEVDNEVENGTEDGDT